MKFKRQQPDKVSKARQKTADVIRPHEPDAAAVKFDAKRDMPPEIWESIFNQLRGVTGAIHVLARDHKATQEAFKLNTVLIDQFWYEWSGKIGPTAFLFPEKKEELGINDEVWEVLNLQVNNESRDHLWLLGVANLALTFPDHIDKLRTDENRERARAQVQNFRQLENLYTIDTLQYLIAALRLFPELRKEFIDLDTAWSSLKKKSESYKKFRSKENYIAGVAALGLLYPDHRSELTTSNELWDELRETITQEGAWLAKSLSWERVPRSAMNMTIAAADKAEITPDGMIRLSSDKPLQAGAPLPERPQA